MKVLFVVIAMCLIVSVAQGQNNHSYEWTEDLGEAGEAINWRPIPAEAVTYEMDGANAKVLLIRPAPMPVSNTTTIGLIVDTEPDMIPPGEDGAWHRAIIDLSVVGLTMPNRGKKYIWIRYSYPNFGLSDEDVAIFEKKKAGKPSVVPG
jgi:hypothetical protein